VSRIRLARALLRQLRAESLRTFPNETGGILMGWWSADDHGATVRSVIGPGPKAQHGRYTFIPDDEWQEREVARLYQESGRTLSYLGDWHTHPYGIPTPSIRDRRTLCRIARHRAARAPQPLMLILGVSGRRTVVAGAVRYTRGILRMCEIAED